MYNIKHTLVFCLSFCFFPFLQSSFAAQASKVALRSDSEIGVVQRKYTVKRMRFELIPASIATVTNDPYVNTYFFALGLGAFITDDWGVELNYHIAYNSDNDLNRVLQNDFGKLVVSGKPQSMYNANLNWSPVNGKFAFFNNYIVHFDTYISAGIGKMKTDIEEQNMYVLGIGQRYFLTRVTALKFDIRNYIHKETRNDIIIDKKNLVVSIGLSFLLPEEDVDR